MGTSQPCRPTLTPPFPMDSGTPARTQPLTWGEGRLPDVPIRGPAAQLHSAAHKETQIKCQLIVCAEEVLI